MIAFQDFKPKLIKAASLTRHASYESLDEILISVNHWVEQNGVKVLNVETVVFPMYDANVFKRLKRTYISPNWAGHPYGWVQFIRVWYDAPE